MRTKLRSLLKQQDIRKSSPKNIPATSIQINKQDALKFLSEIAASSADLIVSSPPYCIGKVYETSVSRSDFIDMHQRLAPLLVRALKRGGSLCWQIGHHVSNGAVTPLDALVYAIFSRQPELVLRNRIIWTFAHGIHASKRFSGRHETVLWFTKGDEYSFNLDAVRVPQKYPGKRHYKGPRKGKLSGNPLGKNPSDVWDIPNVKANHVEKVDHPCQFPVALVQRLIRALAPKNGLVLDPFLGSGSSAVAAAIERRSFSGCDIHGAYVKMAKGRIAKIEQGAKHYRPIDQPIHVPSATDAVARLPTKFQRKREGLHDKAIRSKRQS